MAFLVIKDTELNARLLMNSVFVNEGHPIISTERWSSKMDWRTNNGSVVARNLKRKSLCQRHWWIWKKLISWQSPSTWNYTIIAFDRCCQHILKYCYSSLLLAKKPETGTGARLNTTKLVSAYVTLFFSFIRLLLLNFK